MGLGYPTASATSTGARRSVLEMEYGHGFYTGRGLSILSIRCLVMCMRLLLYRLI